VDELPDDIGQRIHQLRLGRGLTQRDLAEPKYTAAYVSSVESGKRKPSSDAMRYFAQRLEVSEQELATGQPGDSALSLSLAFTEALAGSTGSGIHGGSTGYGIHGVATGAGVATGFAEVAAVARQLGEHRWQAWALIELGQLDEAAGLLAGELPLDRVPLVLAQSQRAETRYAIHLLQRVRDEMFRDGFPDPDARHAISSHLAAHYLELGDDARAGEEATEALEFAGQPAGAADGYLMTARNLIVARRLADAAVALGQARAAFRRKALEPVIAACHRARGWIRRDSGQWEPAAADLLRARELYADAGKRLDVAVELAEVQRMRGLPDLARELLDEVLATPEPGTPLRVAHAYRELGLIAIAEGSAELAEARLLEAVEIYRRSGPRHDLARALRVLGDLLTRQERFAEAARTLRDGLVDLERISRN
jgi:tetratricopeptide (TPR) repeat protein